MATPGQPSTVLGLTELAAADVATSDLLPIWDVTAGVTKKVTNANLLAGLGVLYNSAGTYYANPLPAAAYPTGWLATWDAGTISGNDGDTVTSWAGGLTATASSTAPTLKKAANGINGLPVVRFGSGKYMQAASGGASLGSGWYVAAVVRPASLAAYQWFVSWGNESNGQRRASGLSSANFWSVNGYNADITAAVAAVANTAYLVETQNNAGVVTVWVNGTQLVAGSPAYNAFASAVVTIGANNGGTETWTGDVARLYIKSSLPTAAEVSALRYAAAADYGLTVAQDYSPLTCGALTCGAMTAGKVYATAPVQSNAEHILISTSNSSGLGRNVLRLQQTQSTGFSCVYCVGHDVAAGLEGYGAAFGWGNSAGTAVFNGRSYIESYNLDSAAFKPYTLVHTNNVGSYRRYEADASGNIIDYNRSAVYPNEGQVSVRGLAPTATANAGVLTTVISTPAYGVLIVRDNSSGRSAVYALEGTTLTALSANAIFSTTKDTSSKVNVYAESNVIKVQNNSGGSLNLTAALYGA